MAHHTFLPGVVGLFVFVSKESLMSVTSVTLPSAFAAGVYSPPFNPLQAGNTNVVSGETQVVTANAGALPQLFIPSYAPFFAASVVLYFTPAGSSTPQLLTTGVDFYYAFPFLGASRAIGVAVYGGLILANNQLNGTITLNYSTLGGTWTQSVAVNQAAALRSDLDPYITAWEQVMTYATSFPIVTSAWDKVDTAKMTDVMLAILALGTSISNATATSQTLMANALAHIANRANPHADTTANLYGQTLENVANYLPSTDAQAADSTNTTSYITPAQLRYAIAAALPTATMSTYGTMMFNGATSLPSDATNATKVLTAVTFLSMVSVQTNYLGLLFNKKQNSATFSPFPITFPATWKGTSYANISTLIQAVQNFVGVYPLEYSAAQGKIWFPQAVTPPSLTLS